MGRPVDDELKTLLTIGASAITAVAGSAFAVGGAKEKIAHMEHRVQEHKEQCIAVVADANQRMNAQAQSTRNLELKLARLESGVQNLLETVRDLRSDFKHRERRVTQTGEAVDGDEDT